MTTAHRASLELDERDALSRIVSSLRKLLTRELRRVLEGTFGIKAGLAQPEDESRLSLSPDQLEARRELVELWEALGRRADLLVREAAFTHTNRLIAVRVAEAIRLLPESLARGRRSSGFRQLLEVAPLLGSDDDAGYWEYLRLCGDELAHDVPRLFDPRNPLLALRPPPSIIDDLVGLLSADDMGVPSDHGPAWAAPDTFGWTYQFFNSDEERGEMRRLHPQPADSWELAVRNQFFTPDYVVDFLVHNSLGRRLVEAGVHELVEELDYLIDPPTEPGEPLELQDVKVLDPACGSGHFLLGAYHVLERAWWHRGVGPAEAAASIVASLWGIDIDARAAQVAAAAVMFRARRDNPGADLPTPNIVCARSVPGGAAGHAELVSSVDPSRRDFLAELIDQLERAPKLGSLLKVEELLRGDAARRMVFGGGLSTPRRPSQPDPIAITLMEAGITAGVLDVDTVVNEVLAVAQAAADEVTSTPTERVIAADGGDALRLVQALSHRYDTVLMNPPFGEPIPETKPYLKIAYPWIPTRDYNLFAAFVGRGLELCNAGGYLGAITSRAGMFLTTFEHWRKEVLLGNDLTVLADLGHKVMHDALVEAAAYVVRPGKSRHSRPATFIRLLRERPELRARSLNDVCQHLRSDAPDERIFHIPVVAFDVVPGLPMAYWLSPGIRRLFRNHPSLEGHGAAVRQGLATGEDFRFVRLFWEVDPTLVGRSREDTFGGRRWVPFAKGGEYSPFWADVHLVVDYERDGERLRVFPGSVIRNPQYYFEQGLTWPLRTASGFSPRILPRGCAFSHKGPAVITKAGPLPILGWLTSRTASAALAIQLGAADETSSGGASKSYEVGLVAKLPWPSQLADDELISDLTRQITLRRRSLDEHEETCREFRSPVARFQESIREMASDRWMYYEQHILDVLDLSAALETEVVLAAGAKDAVDFVEQEMGTHPSALPHTPLPPGTDLEGLMALPMERLVSAAAERGGNLRVLTQKNYVVDRRIEVLAHAFQVHPEVVIAARRVTGVLPPEHVQETVLGVASYLVGCAFGRWDVRTGRDPSAAPPMSDDPFAPVPVCPPGMLVGPGGFPEPSPPSGYPLRFTNHRVLLDEPGHPADIGAAIEAAAAALVDEPRGMLDELARLLGVTDLPTYLRKRFFKDHLSRYSKSRRRAPIYWPLTTPSRAWTAWVYAPTLTREAIYAVAAHAERRLDAAEVEIRRMESAQLQASAPGGSGHDPALVRLLVGRLDTERRLSEELRAFRRVVTRVAESGWSPDLDDGIVLCAAPFAEVFPDWPKEVAETAKQLRAGKFEWSTMHRHRGVL